MKKSLKASWWSLLAITLLFASCKKDDETPPPAPQITSDKASLNLVPYATDKATLAIVAPGSMASITATADKGTVTVTNVKGTDTNAGSAEVNYTAPEMTGTFKITVTVTDKAKQVTNREISVSVTAKPPVNLAAGNVSGTWEKGTTYIAGGELVVPVGQTLTIEEGVTIIFDGDGTQGSPELLVRGTLYSYGTKAAPVVFTIPEAKRVKGNIFKGLWGGVQATTESPEMVLQYTTIEYAGAPVGAGNPLVDGHIYDDGAPRYGLLYSNPSGKFVMQNSRIAYTADDAMRVIGGTVLITNNFYELVGKNGGEAINIKSSVTGDVAYNIVYSAATNGIKWSNKSGSAPTPQTDIRAYNNTIVASGWRQTKTGRGGSFNIEEAGRGVAYNNLVVNSRFGVRLVSSADVENTSVGYNLYYGTEQAMVDEFYPTAGIVVKGQKETDKDVAGAMGENDPKFVQYTATGFASAAVKDPSVLDYLGSADFHLQAGSPALTKGKTGFSTKNTSLTVGGKTYTVPQPSNFIGALSTSN